MKSLPLVSIVTPCLNGENFVSDYFDSILNQTYKNIQLVFVDDGSTDATAKIANEYKVIFERNNIEFIYLYQHHGGQSKALNLGLKHISGKYLIWPDSDDYLEPASIEKRVKFLEENPKYGFVRSNGKYIDYKTKELISRISNNKNYYNSDIFLDLILERTYCSCGCYMIKVNEFKKIYPTLTIQESSAGQNWQILIPYAAKYLCGYIDEDLYIINVREDSHSHVKRNEEETIQRMNDLKNILVHSIKLSNRSDKDYLVLVNKKYEKELYRIYFTFKDFEKVERQYKILKKDLLIDDDIYKVYLRELHPIKYNILRPIWYIKKHILKN